MSFVAATLAETIGLEYDSMLRAYRPRFDDRRASLTDPIRGRKNVRRILHFSTIPNSIERPLDCREMPLHKRTCISAGERGGRNSETLSRRHSINLHFHERVTCSVPPERQAMSNRTSPVSLNLRIPQPLTAACSLRSVT